jgi:Fe-S cluster assembly protein SufD
MALLNGGLYDNGWLVTIPDNMAVACPITVVCVTTAKADAGRARPFINTRGLVHLESGAKATMRVVWVDLSPQEDKPASFAALHNTAIEVALHPGAQLTLSLHQHNPQTGVAHFVHTDANLQRESCLTLNTLALSGALTRFAAGVQYIEPQAQCILNGLSLLTGQTQTHHHTRVVHRLPACQTDQMYRGMALDQTRLEFDGTIHVDPDAQQTQAVQVNNNLLLSEQARVWSRPQLKIDADDVKCAHGATVGQLDETALFYCRSRGLGPEDARRLLLQGFAGAVLSRVEDTALVARVYEHLKAIL